MAMGFIPTNNFQAQLNAARTPTPTMGGNRPITSVAAPAAQSVVPSAAGAQTVIPPVPTDPSQFNARQLAQAVQNHSYDPAAVSARRAELFNGPNRVANFQQYIRGFNSHIPQQQYRNAQVTAQSDPVPAPKEPYKAQVYSRPNGYTSAFANNAGYPSGFVPIGA